MARAGITNSVRSKSMKDLFSGISDFGLLFIQMHLNDRGADEMGRTIYNHLFFHQRPGVGPRK